MAVEESLSPAQYDRERTRCTDNPSAWFVENEADGVHLRRDAGRRRCDWYRATLKNAGWEVVLDRRRSGLRAAVLSASGESARSRHEAGTNTFRVGRYPRGDELPDRTAPASLRPQARRALRRGRRRGRARIARRPARRRGRPVRLRRRCTAAARGRSPCSTTRSRSTPETREVLFQRRARRRHAGLRARHPGVRHRPPRPPPVEPVGAACGPDRSRATGRGVPRRRLPARPAGARRTAPSSTATRGAPRSRPRRSSPR